MAVPGGPGGKKPKPKDPVRDRPQDPGHGTPPVSDPGGGGGSHSPYRPGTGQTPPSGGGGGGGTGGYQGTYRPTPPAWVVRRQQILRKAGYNVGVDGVWGARSEAAWSSFQRGISAAAHAQLKASPAPGINPQLAKIQQLVHQARIIAEQSAASHPPTFPIEARHRNIVAGVHARQQAAADFAAHKALNSEAQAHLQALAGIDGLKDPNIWQKRAAQGALSMHDIDFLLRHGEINAGTSRGVRVIQTALNRALPNAHVAVDGVWGKQTTEAFRHAIAEQNAKDWIDAVHQTQVTLFATHIAQRVVPDVLGHPLTPAELTAFLQRGGPDAARLSAQLSAAYESHREDGLLHTLQTARANQLGAPPPGPAFLQQARRSIGRFALLGSALPQDQILGSSRTLGEYIRRELDYIKRQRAQAAQQAHTGGGGFWGTVTSYVSPVLNTIAIPGKHIEGWAFALDAEYQSLTGGGFGAIGYQARGAALGQTAPNRGLLGWHTAYMQGRIAYTELPGWQGLVADIATDPFSYIGGGALESIGRAGLTLGVRTSLRTIDIVDHFEPIIGATGASALRLGATRTLEGAILLDRSHPIQAAKSAIGWTFANHYPGIARAYILASTTRAIAAARVADHVRETFSVTLRAITRDRLSAAANDAAAAMQRRANEITKLLDPEHIAELDGATTDHLASLRAAAPDLMKSLDQLPVSLYATQTRAGGVLSIAGRRFEARILNVARVTILARYAILRHLAATLDPGLKLSPALESLTFDQLTSIYRNAEGDTAFARLLKDARAMTHGSVPHDWRDAYTGEIAVISERLHRQILPAIDDELRLRLGEDIWHTDGTLLREGASDTRAALDRYFGHTIEDYYTRTVTIANPNHLIAVSGATKARLVADEVGARSSSVYSYAEMQTRIEGIGKKDHWLAWAADEVARVRETTAKAWYQRPEDGKWVDLRPTLQVPAAVVETLPGSAAHTDLGVIGQLTADVGHASNIDGRVSDFTRADLSHQAIQAAIGRNVDNWRRFAGASQRLETIHALVENRVVARAYADNWLMMGYLRHVQGRGQRLAYYALAGSMGLWKTAVLPFRPAFFFRNYVDNWIKNVISGLHDPRLWFNAEGRSLFQVAPVRAILGMVGWFDRLYGTDARRALHGILDRFWTQHESTINAILGTHGIEAPPDILEAARTVKSALDAVDDVRWAPSLDAVSRSDIVTSTAEGLIPESVRRAASRYGFKSGAHLVDRFVETMWHQMAIKPETYAKRALYTSEYRKAIAEGLDPVDAMARAVKLVEHTLFDYDQISVAEENLKLFFPFIFFFRKNLQFWATAAVEKPWIFLTADKVYNAHLDSNSDQPAWMRRYVNLGFLADPLEAVGAPNWITSYLRNSAGDPLNYISIVQAYRAFKDANPGLPNERDGSWGFVAGVLDSLQTIGLGANPFLMSAGQRLGFLNMRSWQDIFPQTTFLQAMSDTEWIRSMVSVGPNGFNLEDWALDPLFKLVGADPRSDMSRERFDQLVNQEMAFQAARGDTVSASAAEAKVRGFFVYQTIMGLGLGLYPRVLSPEVRGLYAIINERAAVRGDTSLTDQQRREQLNTEWLGLTPEQQKAYSLFAKRTGYTPRQLQNYSDAITAASAWASLDNYDERQKFLADHPEIAPIINPVIGGNQPSEIFLRDLVLSADTEAVIGFTQHYLHGIDASFDVVQAARDKLITPSLRAFWAKNDTTSEQRARHTAGQYFHYLSRLNDTYYAIPAGDFQARSNFLAAHPILGDWWAKNDAMSDDFRAVYQSVNGTYRDLYFRFVERGDWNSADEFLRIHPHIFDFTSAEGRVNPDGSWLPKTRLQAEYAKISDLMDTYYALPASDRSAYLDAHPLLERFWNRYASKGTPMKPGYNHYFPGGLSQHAKDYLAVKAQINAYFALPDAARSAYLADHPELKAYFAKYSHERSRGSSGRNGHTSSSFGSSLTEALSQNPDIAMRYRFWQTFFALPPDQRAEFIHKHAADAGIFIYGSLSYDQRQREEAQWHRMALRLGETDKQYLYLKVAPLLKIYFALPSASADRALFLEMNPELQLYFERYSSATQGLPPAVAKLVEQYFALEPFSAARGQFVLDHPELKAYFNSKASPAERALQRSVDAYFHLPFGPARDAYLFQHPEVKLYFDQRAREHALFSSFAAAFNSADPRMAPYYAMYADIIPLDAIKRFQLAWHQQEVYRAPARIDRAPEKPKHGGSPRHRGTVGTRRDRAPD